MPSRVLGNDPFKRGTAERPEVPRPPARPAPKKARARPPSTPELQVPRAAPAVTDQPPAPPAEVAAAPRASHPVLPPRPPASAPPAPMALAPSPVQGGLRASLRGLVDAVKTAAGLSPAGAQLDTWGKDAHLAQALAPLAARLYQHYWRVKVEGASQLPSGPCVIVANHAGALPLDGPLVHLALQRERPDLAESRWLLEDQVFHAPFIGVLANRLGAVRASPENAHRLLEEGRPIIVFPEGFHGLSKSFSERYQLKRFGRGGSVKIAARAGVPLVPVAIVGGEEAMPLLGKLPGGFLGVEYLPLTLPPLPARWHLRFGEPVRLHDVPADLDADLAWVQRANEQLRDTIRSMLTSMLAQRKGVFRGD